MTQMPIMLTKEMLGKTSDIFPTRQELFDLGNGYYCYIRQLPMTAYRELRKMRMENKLAYFQEKIEAYKQKYGNESDTNNALTPDELIEFAEMQEDFMYGLIAKCCVDADGNELFDVQFIMDKIPSETRSKLIDKVNAVNSVLGGQKEAEFVIEEAEGN